MDAIIISPNVTRPYLCIMKKGAVLDTSIEEHQKPKYPIWSTTGILSKIEGKYDLVIVGKPLIYARNLIYMHSFMFPFAPAEFIKSIYCFFDNYLSPEDVIKKTKLNSGFLVNEKIRFEDIYYIRQDDALAYCFKDGKSDAFITCLTDVFEGSSFCIYETKQKFPKMIKEANPLNSLSTLLKIKSESGHLPQLTVLPGGFRLRKRNLKIIDSSLKSEKTYANDNKILRDAFSSVIKPLVRRYRRMHIISDADISEMAKNIKGLKFTYVTAEKKLEAVCRYAAKINLK